MSLERGFEVKTNAIKHWELLLREWIFCFEKFCDLSQTTPAWNCPEKTNVGILAAAAWQIGWIVGQELKLQKSSLHRSWGYPDLWLYSPIGAVQEYIECKGDNGKDPLDVRKILGEACKDAENLIVRDGSGRIGVAFYNLKFEGCRAEEVTAQVEAFLGGVTRVAADQSDWYDAVAWCFPPSVSRYQEEPGQFTPGVVLLAKCIV